ncbi:2462_t:CDS:2, partial [Ambispora leptoticha]
FDKVYAWITDLNDAKENIYQVFEQELEFGLDNLDVDDYNNLCIELQDGIQTALEGFVKWMQVWIHLPLSICCLGDNNEEDIKEGNLDTFGLSEALKDEYRIWTIVVHQQQLEGMFNRYDLKVHPNMDLELQEARMILSTSSSNSLDITREKLQDIRTILQDKNKLEKEAENDGIGNTNVIFKSFVSYRKR